MSLSPAAIQTRPAHCLLVALTLSAAQPAGAETRRYALLVGANRGDAGDEPLVYAERDAVRLADVLTAFGDVAPGDLLLLRGARADAVERAVGELTGRIAARRATAPDDDAVLLVYYSGHASAREMHLSGSRLAFRALQDRLTRAAATVAVLLVDACRSGGLTRVKGGVKARPFEIRADDRMESAGMAIITSSAAGEDAQESERLQGGIFTHHVITGLMGGADASKDQRVTLAEVYRYAYEQTIRTTSRTQFVQHPTYSFSMKGREELVLTRLNNPATLGRLRLDGPGSWLVLQEARGGALVAEIGVSDTAELLVPAGRYVVRRRSAAAVWEGTVSVPAGAAASPTAMSQLAFGRTVRKGMSADRRSAWSLTAGGEVSSPVLPHAELAGFAALGALVDLADVALQLRGRYGMSSATNDVVSSDHRMYGADLGAWKLFDLPGVPLAMGLGVRGGGDWVAQDFQTAGRAQERGQWVWRVAPVLRTELTLGARFLLTLDAGADVWFPRLLQTDGASELTPRVVGFGGLALGVYLP